jgi:hypothetical protein
MILQKVIEILFFLALLSIVAGAVMLWTV